MALTAEHVAALERIAERQEGPGTPRAVEAIRVISDQEAGKFLIRLDAARVARADAGVRGGSATSRASSRFWIASVSGYATGIRTAATSPTTGGLCARYATVLTRANSRDRQRGRTLANATIGQPSKPPQTR